jgi:hypothetical protein
MMPTQHAGPSTADVATEVNALAGGLGILTFAIFPLALPGLLLFVVAPLALVGVLAVALSTPFVLLVGLTRIVLRLRSSRRSPAAWAGAENRTITAGQGAATP